jgi:hypothetical protein
MRTLQWENRFLKIYIAGSFLDQRDLRGSADQLWKLGHEITGSWLQEVAQSETLTTEEFKRKLALKDIAEVYAADLIIQDNRRSSGGKNVEWGIGLGQFQKKLLWLVGKPSHVFHYLADKQFKNWMECIECLK